MEPTHKSENKRFLQGLENRADIDKYFADQARFLVAKQKMDCIDNFNDEFDFLNNDFESPVALDGELYPTLSAAYQAARTTLAVFRFKFQGPLDPYEFFDLAKQIPNPTNWDAVKLEAMERLVRDKFVRSSQLREKLAATGNRELVNAFQDETPANLYWGMVKDQGQNQLGKLLMKTRKSVQEDTDIADWIQSSFHFPQDKPSCADFVAQVRKEGEVVDTRTFRGKGWFLVGNTTEADFPMAHPTISRRHCLFGFDLRLGIVVMDLGSTNGTKVGETLLSPFLPHQVSKIRFELVCGQSSRTNEVSADFTFLKRQLEREKRRLMEGDVSVRSGGKISKIHVSGTGQQPRKKDLERLFDRFGEVRLVDILTDSRRKDGGWYGFVSFFGSRAVDRVLREPGVYLGAQKVAVSLAK